MQIELQRVLKRMEEADRQRIEFENGEVDEMREQERALLEAVQKEDVVEY